MPDHYDQIIFTASIRYTTLIGNKKIAELLRSSSHLNSDSNSCIWIYSEQSSDRLFYTCDFIFRLSLRTEFKIITQLNEKLNDGNPWINYSKNDQIGGIQIIPEGLLFETDIRKDVPAVRNEKGNFCLFPDKIGDSFDLFAAVFFMISRYEEWQAHTSDQHGRFELQQSILYKNAVHLRPVVDEWITSLREKIIIQFSTFSFPKREFRTLASIDVDNLFAYKHKGLLRTSGAILKDVLKMNLSNARRRISVINDKQKDPFDIYDSFSEFCRLNNIPLIYFFLFNDKGKYNRTIDPTSEIFAETFNRVREHGAIVGLHPGYDSKKSEEYFNEEYNNFCKVVKEKTEFTRQHYLRFHIRETVPLLMKYGIRADFSMGFASGSGFRAGTSEAFPYFDLERNKLTKFMLVPFCAMDGVYFVYQNISAERAFHELMQIKEAVKRVNGLFTTVFHERTFDDHLYPGFGEMYKKLLTS